MCPDFNIENASILKFNDILNISKGYIERECSFQTKSLFI